MNVASIAAGSKFELIEGVLRIDTSSSEMNAHTLISTEVKKVKRSDNCFIRIRTNCISSETEEYKINATIHYRDWSGRKVAEPCKKSFTQYLGVLNEEIELEDHEGVSKIAITLNMNKNIQTLIDIEEITFIGDLEMSLMDSNLIHKGFNKYAENRKICIGEVPRKTRGTNLIGRFLGFGETDPRETMSVLHLDRFENMNHYISEVKKSRKVKGAIIPTKSKSYVSHEFHLHNFIPDYLDINESADIRQGKPMSESYLRTAPRWQNSDLLHPKVWKEERTKGHGLYEYVDDENWGVHYGIFHPEDGHYQGDIQVDKRLVGYLFVARFGDAAIYSYIIGHSEHNRNGIMHKLHFDFIEQVFNEETTKFSGIKCILYAGHYQGETEDGIRFGGLTDWKESKLFSPTNLMAFIRGKNYDQDIILKIMENIGIEKREGETSHEALRASGLIEEEE